jgi:hypothetical protein
MSEYQYMVSARVFLENPAFEKIVKLCRLTPIKNWRAWQDEYGNTLNILDDKSIKITRARKETAKTTDVFFKSNPINILKHTNWLMYVSNKKQTIILFLCEDNRLRMSYFVEGKWKYNLSPLLSGIYVLNKIATGYMNDSVKKIPGVTKSFIVPELVFSTGWPTKGKLPCALMIK